MRPRPARLERLPEQYFTALLARITAVAADGGEPVVDLGRGNPEVGPPPHVVDRLREAAREAGAHGYPPFLGLPALKEAIAERYRDRYGVALDPAREVAVVPGTKTALVELALVTAERGTTVILPDPGYADYPAVVALAGAHVAWLPLDPAAGWAPEFAAVRTRDPAALFLNYPSNPCAAAAAPDVFAEAVRYAETTGVAVIHDFAYGDLVFDGRTPTSFLSSPGAKEVGVETFSMSKTYGMAGWRLGFVVGNAELVARLDLVQEHARGGIFRPVQEAGIAALRGPQESVAERVARYERRRDEAIATLAGTAVGGPRCEGTFFVWFRLPEGVTAERLLLEHRVAVAPGEGFGPRGAGWARISLALTDEEFGEGLRRLAAALV